MADVGLQKKKFTPAVINQIGKRLPKSCTKPVVKTQYRGGTPASQTTPLSELGFLEKTIAQTKSGITDFESSFSLAVHTRKESAFKTYPFGDKSLQTKQKRARLAQPRCPKLCVA